MAKVIYLDEWLAQHQRPPLSQPRGWRRHDRAPTRLTAPQQRLLLKLYLARSRGEVVALSRRDARVAERLEQQGLAKRGAAHWRITPGGSAFILSQQFARRRQP